MGTFGSGERYGDNPFIIFKSSEYVINPQSPQDAPNPLRAMYEDMAPLLIRVHIEDIAIGKGGRKPIYRQSCIP